MELTASSAESPGSATTGSAQSGLIGTVPVLQKKKKSIEIYLHSGQELKLTSARCVIASKLDHTLTFGTLVHLLGLLQPGGHFALAVAVGGRQAAVAAAAGSWRLPRQVAGLGLLLGDIWGFCLNLHVERFLFFFLQITFVSCLSRLRSH